MFQRQGFGSFNPFQTLGGGVNPFAQYTGAVNPFHQFTGGINPLQQQVPWQIPGLMSPFQQLATGVNPFLLGAGIGPLFGQVAGAAQPPVGIPGIGVPPGVTGFGIHPLLAQFGYGAGPVNPYLAHIGALGGINPLSIDPVGALMLAQQQVPVSQQLPIRPLVGQSPFDHFQVPTASPIFGQAFDPYAALIYGQMASQVPTNPLQHLIRGQIGAPTPWGTAQGQIGALTPWGTAQTSPFTNPNIPFGI